MSTEPTPREVIAAAIDAALIESNTRWDDIRIAERDLAAMKDAVSGFDAEAHRLRMALFALDGEHDKNFGDANKVNHSRANALRRGEA